MFQYFAYTFFFFFNFKERIVLVCDWLPHISRYSIGFESHPRASHVRFEYYPRIVHLLHLCSTLEKYARFDVLDKPSPNSPALGVPFSQLHYLSLPNTIWHRLYRRMSFLTATSQIHPGSGVSQSRASLSPKALGSKLL